MSYEPRIPLWEHQQEALRKMTGHEYFALFMAMRTGKSATLLADFGRLELEQKVQDLCIIAPAGVYRTWVQAIKDHMSEDLSRRAVVHVWRSGSLVKEKEARKIFLNEQGPRILLINCEALSLKGEARNFITKFLCRKNMVVIDESTVIKNRSKRTEFINRHVRPLTTYRRILSGLPTPRDALDIYRQCEFLHPRILGYSSFTAFRNRFAVLRPILVGGRSVQIVVGFYPQTNETIQKLIEPYSYRVPFRPNVPSTWSIREVMWTPEQEKAYKELKEFATTELANHAHVTASVVIAQIMRMHQVLCGHVKDELGKPHSLPENRSTALLEELEDYEGKAVIWFTYISDLEKCALVLDQKYGTGSTARFYGSNASTREEDEQRFKTNPNCRFMLATAGAGGRGRTWSEADRVIYYSNSDNLDFREQSEQRTLGVEKMRGVDYVDLIVPDTVDMKILQALRKKINMSTAITGDNYREWLI